MLYNLGFQIVRFDITFVLFRAVDFQNTIFEVCKPLREVLASIASTFGNQQ